MTARRVLLLAVLAAPAAMVLGCGDGGQGAPAGTPGSPSGGPARTAPSTQTSGSSESPSATPSTTPSATERLVDGRGRTFGSADDGTRIRLRLGETATLRLDSSSGPEPRADSDAVLLIRVHNVQPTPYREWEIRAADPGTAQITIPTTGSRAAILTVVVQAS